MIKNIFNKLLGKKEEQSNLKVKVSFSEPNRQEYVKKEYPEELLNRNLKEIGVLEDNCPYCNEKLEKRPTRKKKCSSCSNFIFVKKRPIDRKEVLLKEEELPTMEKQWDSYYLNKKDIDMSDDELYVKVKSNLKKQFGFEPPINDVLWGYYEHQKMDAMKIANWSSFRNAVLSQAQQLKKEKKLDNSLNLYLEVMWYDLTGAQRHQPEFGDLSPEFNPKMVFVAPGIVSEIQILQKKLGLEMKDIKKHYDDYVRKACSNPRSPLSHDKVWKKLEEAIK